MSVMAATGIVVGGAVTLGAIAIGLVLREWRAPAIFLAIVSTGVVAGFLMTWLIAVMVGDAAGFWSEVTGS